MAPAGCGSLPMPCAVRGRIVAGMSEDRERLARLRDEEDRESFAIRRLERTMAEEEHELEGRLAHLEGDIDEAEHTVDRDLREEEFGHEPEHPPFWHAERPRSRRPHEEERAEGDR